MADKDSYWLVKLRNHLIEKDSTLRHFKSQIEEHKDKLILIKFWASWCRPCLNDDEKLSILKTKGEFDPFVIGVQNDKKPFPKTISYLNFLDSSRIITSYYNVGVFPTYILLENGINVVRTTSLQELLDYYKLHK
ncbi:MAG: thioredoxin domain-containing protein [Bacteroidota bacterium]|nr:thioredoxin domain-containing protein [Bacteroidota bacterium]